MRLFAIAAVVASSLVGWGVAPANAAPLCEEVATSGYLLTSATYGGCIPYGGSVVCQKEDAGFDPAAHLYTEFCVPFP